MTIKALLNKYLNNKYITSSENIYCPLHCTRKLNLNSIQFSFNLKYSDNIFNVQAFCKCLNFVSNFHIIKSICHITIYIQQHGQFLIACEMYANFPGRQ